MVIADTWFCNAAKRKRPKPTGVTRKLISSKGAITNQREIRMPYCPECGGEMQYQISTKHYVCKSCGLSVTQQELMELRDKLKPSEETADEEKERRRKEYLKWWLSKK